MRSLSLDSQSQASRTRSMSISIPMSSMESYETGNNLVGSTAPLRSARRAPLVHGDMNHRDKVQVWDKVVQNWDNFFVIQNWDKFFFISCLMGIFIDPLLFLLDSVRPGDKCIEIDWNKTKTIFVFFRSLTDVVYLVNILLLKFLRAPKSRGTVRRELNFSFNIFLVSPLPQIQLISSLISKHLGSSKANDASNILLWGVLTQYIPRVLRFLPLLAGLTFGTGWTNFFINLFTFVLSGHVIGAMWYLLGFQRVKQCLRDACYATYNGDHQCLRLINCGDKNAPTGNNPVWKIWKDNWKNNTNAIACFSGDSFEYGIYKPAVKLTSKNLPKRYFYSLFWGFQQISTLAGNQQPSDYVPELLFTMLIMVVGLLLFAFLIGNMQNFLQGLDRRQEFSLRQRDVKQWMNHRRLPEELRKRVRAAEKYNWEVTGGVNEGMLIENLPEDIQKDIRRHMFEFVKTVQNFTLIDQQILDAICERLKQTIYIKGSKILHPGSVVDKMVFIVHGKLESIGDDGTVTRLCEGSVCGEELFTWFLEHTSVSNDGKKIKMTGQGLLSNRTVKCLTDVEAFSLRAADLEEVSDYFASLKKTERNSPEGPE